MTAPVQLDIFTVIDAAKCQRCDADATTELRATPNLLATPYANPAAQEQHKAVNRRYRRLRSLRLDLCGACARFLAGVYEDTPHPWHRGGCRRWANTWDTHPRHDCRGHHPDREVIVLTALTTARSTP